MSLAEIEEAVKKLTPEELTELAAYVTRQDKARMGLSGGSGEEE